METPQFFLSCIHRLSCSRGIAANLRRTITTKQGTSINLMRHSEAAEWLAFCKFTMPRDSSWYARVTTGGATTMMLSCMLSLGQDPTTTTSINQLQAERFSGDWAVQFNADHMLTSSLGNLRNAAALLTTGLRPYFVIQQTGSRIQCA